MKAIVFRKYGSPDVLKFTDVDQPIPKDDEVLIRVHAASLNDWDWEALRGTFINRLIFGLLTPTKQILGSDVAGRVEAAGKNVRRFQPGAEVFGDLSGRWGGFAEYVCAPESALVLKPASMSFEQAAAIPQAALLALQGLEKGRLQRGQKLLINGAGGGAGTFAIQIARLYEAEITAVDRAEKLDMLRSMGAKHLIDYMQEDFTRTGQQYDLIFDVKTKRSIFALARALSPRGTYITVGGSMVSLLQALLLAPWISLTTKKKMRLLQLTLNKGLDRMIELFESGKVVPVIDRLYKLSETPQAFRYFGEGRHKGKVVVTMI